MKRVLAVILRQNYLMRGSPTRILPLFVWVAVDILLWGFLSRYLDGLEVGPGGGSSRFLPSLLGAVLLWDFLVRVSLGVTVAFLEDVWARNFLNFFATPLSVGEYLSGLVLTSIATSLVGLAAMLALAVGVFGLPFLAYGLLAIPYLLILFLTGIALGILAVAVVLRLGPASEWFIWMIPALLSPFAAVFYPLSTLPGWMQTVALAIPPAYVFEGMRAGLASGVPAAQPLLLGGALAAAYVGAACWCFRSVYRKAIRTGIIARYSAESAA